MTVHHHLPLLSDPMLTAGCRCVGLRYIGMGAAAMTFAAIVGMWWYQGRTPEGPTLFDVRHISLRRPDVISGRVWASELELGERFPLSWTWVVGVWWAP